jgi:hypothetical protein
LRSARVKCMVPLFLEFLESHPNLIPNWIAPRWPDEVAEFVRCCETIPCWPVPWSGRDPALIEARAKLGGRHSLSQEDILDLDNFCGSDGEISWAAAVEETASGGRDLYGIAQSLLNGEPVPMPLVARLKNGGLYLVGGNTRLLATTLLGLDPTVWLFDANDLR